MIEFQEKQAPLKCLAKNLFEKLILEFLQKEKFLYFAHTCPHNSEKTDRGKKDLPRMKIIRS